MLTNDVSRNIMMRISTLTVRVVTRCSDGHRPTPLLPPWVQMHINGFYLQNFKWPVNLRYQMFQISKFKLVTNSEVNISHETTTTVVWIYDGV